MAEVNPCFALSGQSHPAEVVRDLVHALRLNAGVVDAGDLVVSQTPTPSMAVQVAAGRAIVQGTEAPWQGSYVVRNDASVTRSIAAASPSLPRNDLVIARVHDQDYSGTGWNWAIEVVTGTPASNPADPPTPASSLVLARVRVNAGVTSIVNANITDLRTFARGKIVPGPAGLRIRNSSDSADNLIVGDGGDLTLRGNLWLPFIVGGAIAPSLNGSTLVKIAETILNSSAATVSFSGMPSSYRAFLFVFSGTTTGSAESGLLCRYNNLTTGYTSSGYNNTAGGGPYGFLTDSGAEIGKLSASGFGPSFGFALLLSPSSSRKSGGGGITFWANASTIGMEVASFSGPVATLSSFQLVVRSGDSIAAGSVFALYGLP